MAQVQLSLSRYRDLEQSPKDVSSKLHMITRVYIDNFRCFSNFEVRPDRANLLIGSNGAGKSKFFDALYNVVGLAVRGRAVQVGFPSNTLTRWDSRSSQRIEIDVGGRSGSFTYLIELDHDIARQTVTLKREMVNYRPAQAAATSARVLFLFEGGTVRLHNNDGKVAQQFPFRGTRSFLSQLEVRPDNALLKEFLQLLADVWLLELNPTLMSTESETESEALETNGRNFASWYRHLSQEHPQDIPILFGRLAENLPGFRSLRAASAGQGGRKRELVADFGQGESGTNYEVRFDELSDGERATIVLYCILLAAEAESMILLLDEPENFVGLQLVQPWLRDLSDATRDEGQLFVISHHPEVIDYLAADCSLLFERPGGGPVRIRANPFDRDEGLKASEIIERGLLGAD
jgi:predicted ATPase